MHTASQKLCHQLYQCPSSAHLFNWFLKPLTFPEQPEAMNSAVAHSAQTTPPLPAFPGSVPLVPTPPCTAPFPCFRCSWSTSQQGQQGVTIPGGRHTIHSAEHALATWPSSNTTMGLICSPCETSSLYFPSWPLLSPDLCTVCNDFRLFCKLPLVQSRIKYIWRSIMLPLLAGASFALVLPRHPGHQTLCSCSEFPQAPAASLGTKTARLRTQPFLLSSADPLSVFKNGDPRKSLRDFCDVVKPDPLLSYLLGSH